MSNPDPLLMSADIARVASERPELDEDLIQAIYQHLVLIESRQPTIDELRDYVDRVSSLEQDKLRQRLGLGPRRGRGRVVARTGLGRPKGTGLLTPMAVRDANRAARAERQGRPPTQAAVAERLEVSVRTLQDFLKANDLAWPIRD